MTAKVLEFRAPKRLTGWRAKMDELLAQPGRTGVIINVDVPGVVIPPCAKPYVFIAPVLASETGVQVGQLSCISLLISRHFKAPLVEEDWGFRTDLSFKGNMGRVEIPWDAILTAAKASEG